MFDFLEFFTTAFDAIGGFILSIIPEGTSLWHAIALFFNPGYIM